MPRFWQTGGAYAIPTVVPIFPGEDRLEWAPPNSLANSRIITPFVDHELWVAQPSGGSVWRGNEPIGFTQYTSRDFNAIIEDSWGVVAAGGSTANFTIVSDPTAPHSPNNVGQVNYPHPWSDSAAEPCNVFHAGSAPRQLYTCMAHKFSSNWVGHPTSLTNKIIHYKMDASGSNKVFMLGYGGGSDPLLPSFGLQGVAANFNFPAQGGGFANSTTGWCWPNQPGHVGDQVVRGTWNQWEVLLDLGTAGSANGSLKWWMNGTLIGNYVNIPLITTTNSYVQVEWAPTWGGNSGEVLSVDQQQFIDAFYASSHT